MALGVQVLADQPESAERLAAGLLKRAGDRLDQFVTDVAPLGMAMTRERILDGWTPRALAHVVRHRDGSVGAGVLAGWLRAEPTSRLSARMNPSWAEQLDDLPPTVEPDLASVTGLAATLRVLAALVLLPCLRPASCADCDDDEYDDEYENEDEA